MQHSGVGESTIVCDLLDSLFLSFNYILLLTIIFNISLFQYLLVTSFNKKNSNNKNIIFNI